ncbi:HAD-IIB family hydrolase [Pseudaminobacter sp. 19-2017]|uniref:HAD-IIB family hydrolase n=1 Tax=Pseudaminobacter soli (ex Zhang et al. 2022) TaxID=2831468 RepID=A0A942I434_9HYPH|nr:HAD-IIB family hydrolase [Pseudaminobacter soli]MBS3652232.1 HAD-IIB family hydrolase [Pseudaminobacter soli]
MYYIAVATDYDGTLAHDGVVEERTLKALQRLKDTGRKLILVTGRELPDLKRVFPELDIFDKVVVENGALLYTPATGEEKPLAPAPSAEFVTELKRRGVEPISVGRSIVATWEPHQTTVLETIQSMGLAMEIIFNKGAVMILPSGINKATGLAAALEDLCISPHNVVAIGDAENDHAFLRACGCSIAVANALPAVKETADLVTGGARGRGVEQLIEELIEHDQDLGKAPRNRIAFGKDEKDRYAELRPSDCILIAGSSGIGKSTLATAITERCIEKKFQFCVVDPEGDYSELEFSVKIGEAAEPPTMEQVLSLLEKTDTNLVVECLGVDLEDRPAFFAEFLSSITGFRAKVARPHWLITDEAHHMLPKRRDATSLALSKQLPGTILITVHPDAMSPEALNLVTVVMALGAKAPDVVKTFCNVTGKTPPSSLVVPGKDQVLYWRPGSREGLRLVTPEQPKQSRKRHTRKYAQGEIDEAGSFYFRGPKGEMKLRAQNLSMFVQIAEGIDDRTWEHHLRAGDYSDWFRRQIRDDELADETAEVEEDESLPPEESRKLIAEAVKRRYTGPAEAQD